MLMTLKQQFKTYILSQLDNIPSHDRFSQLSFHGHAPHSDWGHILEVKRIPSGKFNVEFGMSDRGEKRIWIEDLATLKVVVAEMIESRPEAYCEAFYRKISEPYWGHYHREHRIACYQS